MSQFWRRSFVRRSECRACGAPLSWARNARGKWVPLDRDPFAARDVPACDRLLVRQGIAVAPDEIGAHQPVAVLHFRVCPAVLGDHLPMLRQLWPALAHRAERHQLHRGAGRDRDRAKGA
jgi:hypothetical protein